MIRLFGLDTMGWHSYTDSDVRASEVPRNFLTSSSLVHGMNKLILDGSDASGQSQLTKIDRNKAIRLYYKRQSRVSSADDWFRVSVKYDESLNQKWRQHFDKAVADVNEAVPGLFLMKRYEKTRNYKSIRVWSDRNDNNSAYTVRDVQTSNESSIQLGSQWTGSYEGTAIHELLHALGVGHEHQRGDCRSQLIVDTEQVEEDWKRQYEPIDGARGLTRFDPFSVMMYSESDVMRRVDGDYEDPAWFAKGPPERNIKLSELDKVGLNLTYPPYIYQDYNPKKSRVTGLYYCGRSVMRYHDGGDMVGTTDGNCGPNNWANCPACRVLKNDKVDQIIKKKNKWQGWSGLFYCWKKFTKKGRTSRLGTETNGYCGPDNGAPCQSCGLLLHPDYDVEEMFID